MSWKRWLKRGLVLFLIVGAVSIVSFVGDREVHRWRGNRELADAIARADRTDPNWRWDALNAARPRPPEGKNSADVIDQMRKLRHPAWGEKLYKNDWVEAQITPNPNRRFPPDVVAEARRELERSAGAVKLVYTLRDLPQGYREIELTRTALLSRPDASPNSRVSADMVRWEAEIACEDHSETRMVDAIIACLNLSRAIGDEPSIISQLARWNNRSVATCQLQRALAQSAVVPRLAELQAVWAADAEEPLLLHGLRGERAQFHLAGERLEEGVVDIMDHAYSDLKPAPDSAKSWGQSWLYRKHLPADRALGLDWFTSAVEVAKQPIEEQRRAFAALGVPPREQTRLLSSLCLIPNAKVLPAHWRSVAHMRSAITGIACERFRLQHGRWPKTLAELPPALLAAVPLDPFDGEPLRYRHLPDGVVIYSVGPDLSDDGGELSWSPGSIGPDTGFRLWNPEARRLPYEPPAREDEETP